MLPYNDYFEYYGPDYRLHMPTSNMEDMNKRETLEEVGWLMGPLSDSPKQDENIVRLELVLCGCLDTRKQTCQALHMANALESPDMNA